MGNVNNLSIVVEGPDGSGKSHLIEALRLPAIARGAYIEKVHTGGPSQSEAETEDRMRKVEQRGNTGAPVLFDRTPHISGFIYDTVQGRPHSPNWPYNRIRFFDLLNPTLTIICLPSASACHGNVMQSLQEGIEREHKPKEHWEDVSRKIFRLHDLYGLVYTDLCKHAGDGNRIVLYDYQDNRGGDILDIVRGFFEEGV